MTLQKQQMDLLKEQNESNKQFFANMIKGQQEIIQTEKREKDREFFFNPNLGELFRGLFFFSG